MRREILSEERDTTYLFRTPKRTLPAASRDPSLLASISTLGLHVENGKIIFKSLKALTALFNIINFD